MADGTVYVLTGDGKGKTTTAIGLTLRAVGLGRKVFFAQFLKKGEYSEIKAFGRYSGQITVEQYGSGRFTNRNPSREDIQAAQKGLQRIRTVMAGGEYAMMVLDEANVAVKLGLISDTDLLDVIRAKPAEIDLVITGRHAPALVIEIADTAVEMKARRHYFQKGVKARVGIEK